MLLFGIIQSLKKRRQTRYMHALGEDCCIAKTDLKKFQSNRAQFSHTTSAAQSILISILLLCMQLVLRVSGTGVTPFLIPQQTVLLRAMASVLTTVSLSDLQIRYVTSSVNLRRRLLEDGDLQQVMLNILSSLT